MEERDNTDNAVEDNCRSCWINRESMGCPAVSQVKKYSDTLTEDGIDEDMLDNSTLSQDADEKPLILAQKRHFHTHSRRPKNPDQQKHETEEQGAEDLSVPEDSKSFDVLRTESNNETKFPIEVLIKGEDDSHAALDSFSAGSSNREQRLPLDGHILSNSSLSQEVDEKPFVMTDMSGYPEKCVKIYADKKPHKCPVCEKFFSNRPAMRRHMQRHKGLKPHKCLVCEKGFYYPSELSRHMPSHTGEKPYRCSLCNSAFSCRSSLRVHTRTHTGEKPYKCKLCMATFSQTGHLRTHIMTHSGEKPYKCSHCDAAFITGGTLKTHLRTHTGEKPHKCSYCVATFARPEHLRNHINTHTGEMPFKCQECNSAFNRSSDLGRHMKIHTRNESHKCSYCTATFKSLFHLKSHLKNHANKMSHDSDDTSPCENPESDALVHKSKKRHECTLCNTVFTQPFALKYHLQTHKQRPGNTYQQKNQIEEIKNAIITVQEDLMSVDSLKAESNKEPIHPIEVFIKVEDDAYAGCDSFSACNLKSEQRLAVEEVEDTHIASADFISSCEVPYLQDNKDNVKDEKKEMADQEWTHSISSL